MRTAMTLALTAAGLLACADARSAQEKSVEDQVAEAVLPAPEPFREGATVLGYGPDGDVRRLREGTGPLVCLADDPGEEGFHVACYHESLEPYMARGRELRAGGTDPRDAISRRWEEIEAGELAFPDRPAVLYSLSDPEGSSAAVADPAGLRRLTVVYVRGASAEDLGLPTSAEAGVPWLMFPGKPTAHIMIHD